MSQTTQSQQPASVPGHDPETDPVLARLRRHGSSGGGKKAFVAVAVVGLLVVGGWYAYNVYDSPSGAAKIEEESRAQVEAKPAPPPPPPTISSLQRAEAWCVDHLAATEFAGLPLIESDDGDFFVIYTARAGDSVGAVVERYGKSVEFDAQNKFLGIAKRQHVKRYGGRTLWVGDEIPLPIPIS